MDNGERILKAQDLFEGDQILDIEIVEEAKEILGDNFAELLKRFEVDTQDKFSTIEIARASNDYQSIRDAAHSMKSSSYQMGALKMHHYSAELEGMLNQNPSPSTIGDEERLNALIEGTQQAFLSYLQNISAYI